MKVGEHREALVERVRLLSQLSLALLALIGATFWFVQVVQGGYYRELAENNRLRKLPIHAPRGIIYDRAGRPLVENVPSYNLLLDPTRTRDLDSSLAFAGGLLGRPAAELGALLARGQAAAPACAPVLLAENLRLSEVARFGVHSPRAPRVRDRGRAPAALSPRRADGARPGLSRRGHGRRARGRRRSLRLRRPGRAQGHRAALRRRAARRRRAAGGGGRQPRAAARGARPGRPARARPRADPRPRAPAAGRARLRGGGKVGAVVALDPRNGEILAMVSAPAFNPNLFARRLRAAGLAGADRRSPHHPLQNRALQNTYPPGSVFKIVMAIAGLDRARGGARRRRLLQRRGELLQPPLPLLEARRPRPRRTCTQALRELVRRLLLPRSGRSSGIERIARYARLFGLGERTGIDLEGEKAGLVPDPAVEPARCASTPGIPARRSRSSIGQGPLLVTPLQMAVLMAAVANGGHRGDPAPGRGSRRAPPVALRARSRGARASCGEALWAVVNEGGTGGRGPRRRPRRRRQDRHRAGDRAGDLDRQPRARPTSSATTPGSPRSRRSTTPRLVVVVFVEHGGTGSTAAAPLAKVLYESYFRADLRDHRQLPLSEERPPLRRLTGAALGAAGGGRCCWRRSACSPWHSAIDRDAGRLPAAPGGVGRRRARAHADRLRGRLPACCCRSRCRSTWSCLAALVLVLFFGHEAGGARSWLGIGGLGGSALGVRQARHRRCCWRATWRPTKRALPAAAADRARRARSSRCPMALVVVEPDLGGARDVRADARRRAAGGRGAAAAGRRRARWCWRWPAPWLELRHAGLPARARAHLPAAGARSAGRRLPGAPVEDRGRLGRAPRQGLPAGHAEPAALPAGAPHRLHLRGAGRGVGVRRRGGGARLYALFLFNGAEVAMRARDRAGDPAGGGAALGALAFHVLYNTAMVVGLVPITGIPLPFLSYGGSVHARQLLRRSASSSASTSGAT